MRSCIVQSSSVLDTKLRSFELCMTIDCLIDCLFDDPLIVKTINGSSQKPIDCFWDDPETINVLARVHNKSQHQQNELDTKPVHRVPWLVYKNSKRSSTKSLVFREKIKICFLGDGLFYGFSIFCFINHCSKTVRELLSFLVHHVHYAVCLSTSCIMIETCHTVMQYSMSDLN